MPPNRLATLASLVLLSISLSACSSGDEESDQPPDSTSTSAATEGRTLVATYQSATVYAGSTDYYFEDGDGQLVEFRVSNIPEDQTVELPENLLESDVEEGPPGANPELVGQDFLLVYDDQDQLVSVEPNE